MIEVEIDDLEQLQRFADRLVAALPNNVSIGLIGTLGAGKTSLTQAIARAIGIDASDVTSPTFTLLQSHQGTHPTTGDSITIHHLDAYRIADDDEFTELGVEELFDGADAWTIVEWADRVRDGMPTETLWIEVEIADQSNFRNLRLTTTDRNLAEAIRKIVLG